MRVPACCRIVGTSLSPVLKIFCRGGERRICTAEGGNQLHSEAWDTLAEMSSGKQECKSRYQGWHFLSRRNRTSTAACTGFCSGSRRRWKTSLSLLTAALLFSVLWWLQGAVEEGLGLSSAIITALIHSGMPRSVSTSSRDGWAVGAASWQAVPWRSAFVHPGRCYQSFPQRPVPVDTLLCTCQGCIPSPPALPATSVLSNCVLGPSCAESSEMYKGPGQC